MLILGVFDTMSDIFTLHIWFDSMQCQKYDIMKGAFWDSVYIDASAQEAGNPVSKD